MPTCEFCGNDFSQTSSLHYHQKHTKSCLELQGKAPPPRASCQYCGLSYAKASLVRAHEEKCEKKPTPTEEKLMEENARLRSELAESKEELARQRNQMMEMMQHHLSEMTQLASKRSKITHKTVYHQSQVSNNHLDLSNTDQLHSKLERHLDQDTIGQGQVGVARAVVQNILTTDNGDLLYVCTDQDRHIFRYLNEEGKEVKDIRAGHLKDALQRSGIGRIAVERGQEVWTNEDGSVDVEKMMAYHPKVVEIGMMGNEEHDHRFRNELARLTTVPSSPSMPSPPSVPSSS